jgi:hypothetical protein
MQLIAGLVALLVAIVSPMAGSPQPGDLREFIFSPLVGREIEYAGSATTTADVESVRSFGRGWLFIESYRLTPARTGVRAGFESLVFWACLTWPAR